MTEPQPYVMRGSRVSPMSEEEIEQLAKGFCSAFKLNKRFKKFDQFLESLVEFGITLSVLNDDEWQKATLGLTAGHYDHNSLTITIPNRLYELACKGDRFSLEVIFHELGHLMLCHRPLLHYSNTPPNMTEDAEWQADKFSEVALGCLGFNMAQLSFEFYE